MKAKLEQIKAALRLTIELADRATLGPWETYGSHVWSPTRGENVASASEPNGEALEVKYAPPKIGSKDLPRVYATAAFIAHARTFAPAAAKAALHGIEYMEADVEAFGPHAPRHIAAKSRLAAICREWPE